MAGPTQRRPPRPTPSAPGSCSAAPPRCWPTHASCWASAVSSPAAAASPAIWPSKTTGRPAGIGRRVAFSQHNRPDWHRFPRQFGYILTRVRNKPTLPVRDPAPMLYHLHELQRAFLTPLAAFTDASSQLFSSPFSPLAYTPLSRQLAASCELMHRLGKEYQKPAWNLPTTRIDNRTVRVTETAAIEKPFCRLLHFERAARRTDPRVLLVAPLSGHHATLLRDTVRALLPAHDVYVTDWLDARMVPVSQGRFHLDDYVRYIQEFIRYLGPDVHVISVCQPTVPVLAAIA